MRRPLEAWLRLLLLLALSCFNFAFNLPPVQVSSKTRLASSFAVEEITSTKQNEVMWTPADEYVTETAMKRFQRHVNIQGQQYDDSWKRSVKKSDTFWSTLLDFVDIPV
jgi:hypothetical protein